ncbi:MAG: hypothetical protein IJH36_00185, partial [Clostridia bacterium]|nr:hypothetical protein [Clostridia bacterium]
YVSTYMDGTTKTVNRNEGQRVYAEYPLSETGQTTTVPIYVYADNGTIISNELSTDYPLGPIILNLNKKSENTDIAVVTINPDTQYESSDNTERYTTLTSYSQYYARYEDTDNPGDPVNVPSYTVFINEDPTNPETYRENLLITLADAKATLTTLLDTETTYTPDKDGNIRIVPLDLVERDNVSRKVFRIPVRVTAEAGNTKDYILNVELQNLDIDIEEIKYNNKSENIVHDLDSRDYYVFEDAGISSALMYIRSTSGTYMTLLSAADAANDQAYTYTTESNATTNEFDQTVNFDQTLSSSFRRQDYEVVLHSVFGTYDNGDAKEYTKKYTFASIMKDDDTNLVLYISYKQDENGNDIYRKVEHINGIFETSIALTTKEYKLRAVTDSDYALVGINSNPPTAVHEDFVSSIPTPNTTVDDVYVYVTAQNGTIAPYNSGYYVLRVSRKNEIAEIERITSSTAGITADDIEKDDELDNTYTIFTSNETAQASVVFTAESTGATAGLYRYTNNQWVAVNTPAYSEQDGSRSVDLGTLSKSVNEGVYQLRVRNENAEDDNDYTAYTLRIKSKDTVATLKSITIEKDKPGQYNTPESPVIWHAKAPYHPGENVTIEIVPTDKHAIITSVKRVQQANTSAPETTTPKVLLSGNTTRGTVTVDMEDGVALGDTEYYLITVAPHNTAAQSVDYILQLTGDDDDVDLAIVRIDGNTLTQLDDGKTYNYMVSNDKITPYVEAVSHNTNIISVNGEELNTLSYFWDNEGYEYNVDLANELNTIDVTVRSKYYVDDKTTPNAKKTYTIALYTASSDTSIATILVNTLAAIPRPENPTIFDASIPVNSDNPVLTNSSTTVEITANNGYTNIYYNAQNHNEGKLTINGVNLTDGKRTITFETTSSTGAYKQVYTLNITQDRDNADVNEVYVNDSQLTKGDNTFINLSLFSVIENDTYVATVNRHDPVNITIKPEGAMSSVTLTGDTVTTQTKYRGGVFEDVKQDDSGVTELQFTVTAADGETENTYNLRIVYAGDDDTEPMSVKFVDPDTGAAKGYYGEIAPNTDDYYDDGTGNMVQYKSKYIVNLTEETTVGGRISGRIEIQGANEYQTIVLYDEDGTTVLGTSNDEAFLSTYYNLVSNVANLPFTITSHGADTSTQQTDRYVLLLTRRMPELTEVRADDNLLLYNQVQYTYQALPNANKVKVYVKANDKDAKVQIGSNAWTLYYDEQDVDISTPGQTTFDIPLNISIYPYQDESGNYIYTTRILHVTKGSSALKNISVSIQENTSDEFTAVKPNDYGEYVAVIPDTVTSEYVTITLNVPTSDYDLGLYKEGVRLATGTIDLTSASANRTIWQYELSNLTADRNEFTISVSDAAGNTAMYPLWLNHVSSDTLVKNIIIQRGTSEEKQTDSGADTTDNCDSHTLTISDTIQSVKVYIEANDPTSTVRYGSKSRVGSLEITVPTTGSSAEYDVNFDIISTATDTNGVAISQTHTLKLVRLSDTAELDYVKIDGTALDLTTGSAYLADHLLGPAVEAEIKAKYNGTIEVIDKNKTSLVSDTVASADMWADIDLPLDHDIETTKYVIRVTSESGRRSADYMLFLNRENYVGGLEFLKTMLPGETDWTTLEIDSDDTSGLVYTLNIGETEEMIDLWAQTLDYDATIVVTVPHVDHGTIMRDDTDPRIHVFNTQTDTQTPAIPEIALDTSIKDIYIPIYVYVPASEHSYRYTLHLARKNLNYGDITVFVSEDDGVHFNNAVFSYTDENGADVYEYILTDAALTVADVKASADGKAAMVNGAKLPAAVEIPVKGRHNGTKLLDDSVLNTGELTSYEFRVRAEDDKATDYKKVILNVYRPNSETG